MAVHVLAVLAYKQGQRVTSDDIAESVNTNPVVIRRLLLALQEAKLVETRKGAGHGSRLVRPPSRITLAEVYRAVEEDEPFALPPREPNRKCPVGQCVQDALEDVFVAAQKAMEREFECTSLENVMNSIQSYCGENAPAPKTRAARAQS